MPQGGAGKQKTMPFECPPFHHDALRKRRATVLVKGRALRPTTGLPARPWWPPQPRRDKMAGRGQFDLGCQQEVR
jgi:hypothetical protein